MRLERLLTGRTNGVPVTSWFTSVTRATRNRVLHEQRSIYLPTVTKHTPTTAKQYQLVALYHVYKSIAASFIKLKVLFFLCFFCLGRNCTKY